MPAGLGVFEGAAVYVFGALDASGPAGLTFALARRGRMLTIGLIGVVLHLGAIVKHSLRAR